MLTVFGLTTTHIGRQTGRQREKERELSRGGLDRLDEEREGVHMRDMHAAGRNNKED
jgi:hypothetical protein